MVGSVRRGCDLACDLDDQGEMAADVVCRDMRNQGRQKLNKTWCKISEKAASAECGMACGNEA